MFPEALKATPETSARVETALKQLADVLAGDLQVAEVARVMRLPGSHNSKNSEWVECVTIRRREGSWTLEQLEEWLAKAKPLLKRRVARCIGRSIPRLMSGLPNGLSVRPSGGPPTARLSCKSWGKSDALSRVCDAAGHRNVCGCFGPSGGFPS
jgi:hypothetical protein